MCTTGSTGRHWIVDGCPHDAVNGCANSDHGEKEDECTADEATTAIESNAVGNAIAVQCCTFDGLNATRPGCVEAVTFDEAEAICSTEGMRLCTKEEVYGGFGKSIGCGFSYYHVWTSSQCLVLSMLYGAAANEPHRQNKIAK